MRKIFIFCLAIVFFSSCKHIMINFADVSDVRPSRQVVDSIATNNYQLPKNYLKADKEVTRSVMETGRFPKIIIYSKDCGILELYNCFESLSDYVYLLGKNPAYYADSVNCNRDAAFIDSQLGNIKEVVENDTTQISFVHFWSFMVENKVDSIQHVGSTKDLAARKLIVDSLLPVSYHSVNVDMVDDVWSEEEVRSVMKKWMDR